MIRRHLHGGAGDVALDLSGQMRFRVGLDSGGDGGAEGREGGCDFRFGTGRAQGGLEEDGGGNGDVTLVSRGLDLFLRGRFQGYGVVQGQLAHPGHPGSRVDGNPGPGAHCAHGGLIGCLASLGQLTQGYSGRGPGLEFRLLAVRFDPGLDSGRYRTFEGEGGVQVRFQLRLGVHAGVIGLIDLGQGDLAGRSGEGECVGLGLGGYLRGQPGFGGGIDLRGNTGIDMGCDIREGHLTGPGLRPDLGQHLRFHGGFQGKRAADDGSALLHLAADHGLPRPGFLFRRTTIHSRVPSTRS